MKSLFEREFETALAIAREAAILVARMRKAGVDVATKAGDEPVTTADNAASDLIVAKLKAAFPADAVLSEELPDDGSRLKADRIWMVDPIDGTRDFIEGGPDFGVMLGLVVGGRPQLGVVAQPAPGVTWAGVVGAGAFVIDANQNRTPLRTTQTDNPAHLRLVNSKFHPTPVTDRLRALLGITDEQRRGSVGVKLGLVAQGDRDLYVYPGRRAKLWDSCGPEAILIAAGGRVTDLAGRPLDYGQADPGLIHGLVASNGTAAHDKVLAAIATLGTPPPRED